MEESTILEELEQLEEESIARGIPIIGSEKGEWLLEQIQKIQPKEILELGTANGYSGIILASEGGNLTTVEKDKKISVEAQKNFSMFGINVRTILGDGEDMMKFFDDESFDLVFIDFAKKKYMKVLEEVIRVTKPKGWIIADNITMQDCKDFREAIEKHTKLKTEIIEIKDGLSISQKNIN